MKCSKGLKSLALILANIIAVIVFLAIPPASISGQDLPLVVNNERWFPPVRNQLTGNDCPNFSIGYYLKSCRWNQEFNRDPLLEQNQFNPYFIWNQNVAPYSNGGHYSGTEQAFLFMANQGCASIADLPIDGWTLETFPSLKVREKALSYRSKSLSIVQNYHPEADSLEVYQQISALKDSLRVGKCFVIDIPIFSYFYNMDDGDNVYNCYRGVNRVAGADSMIGSHALTVTGYDDTIRTAQGRGAFKVINSSHLAGGKFYLDYNWFYFAKFWGFTCYFLEEDFTHKPELWLYLDLGSAITGQDLFYRRYIFLEAVYVDNSGRWGLDKRLDFKGWDPYLFYPNFVQTTKINGIAMPLRNKIILVPLHNHDGNHKILADLTDYVKADSFQSMEVLICDPISASFVGADGKIIYSYTREARAKVNETYIKFVGTNKRLIGRVKDLPDTAVVCEDFYSYVAGFHLTPPSGGLLLIKKSVSTFKRKLITFDIADAMVKVEENFGFPQGYVLNQNYPNPFNPTTEIAFSLPENSHVTLTVFNALGQKVATLIDEKRGAGSYQVRWDGGSFPSGVYFYRLETQGFSKTVKMLLMK